MAAPDCAFASLPAAGANRTTWIGCGCPGLAWPLAEQPSNTGGSAQLSSSGSSAAGSTGCAFSSGEFDQRAQHAGIGALALAQRAEDAR